MTSSASIGVQISARPPPSARVVKPSRPQALGVILVMVRIQSGRASSADERAAQDAEGQHDGRADRGDLPGRLGQGGDQHAPADRAEDRRQDQHEHGQRVAPLS